MKFEFSRYIYQLVQSNFQQSTKQREILSMYIFTEPSVYHLHTWYTSVGVKIKKNEQ